MHARAHANPIDRRIIASPSSAFESFSMEHRALGRSGLQVPVLSFGTGTFGGSNEFFGRWGNVQTKEATRLVDVCLEHGLNFFDTADIYSDGASETVLGAALKGK